MPYAIGALLIDMRKLYDVGYDLAVKGIRWAKVPPGYESAAGK